MQKFCLNGLKGWLHDAVKLTSEGNRRKQNVAFIGTALNFNVFPNVIRYEKSCRTPIGVTLCYAWGEAGLIGIVIRKCAPPLAPGSTEI
jgi:hypothetical protein